MKLLEEFTGWVSTRGVFHGGMTHLSKATALCKKWGYAHTPPVYPDDILMGKGWMKLSPRGTVVDIWMDKTRQTSNAQNDFVWDMMLELKIGYILFCGKYMKYPDFIERMD